jgi:hypothetical protein
MIMGGIAVSGVGMTFQMTAAFGQAWLSKG